MEPGETLSEIAKTYGVGMDALMALNGIADADALIVGQRLTLPEQDDSIADLPAPATATAVTYTVQTGDSLSQIAKDLGLTLDALLAANGIGDADRVIVGQVLALPVAVEPGSAAEAEIDGETDTIAESSATATAAVEETIVEPATESAATPTADEALESGSAEAVAPAARAAATPTTTSLNPRYRVQSGDTLTGIALGFGVDVPAAARHQRTGRHIQCRSHRGSGADPPGHRRGVTRHPAGAILYGRIGR